MRLLDDTDERKSHGSFSHFCHQCPVRCSFHCCRIEGGVLKLLWGICPFEVYLSWNQGRWMGPSPRPSPRPSD